MKKDSVACTIIEKLDENKYAVKVLEDGANDDQRLDVPADAFFFVDLPYERPHFSFQAFRHAMMIPDDMFPEVWKSTYDRENARAQDKDEEDSYDDGEDEVFVDEEEESDDSSAVKRKPKGCEHDESSIIELPEAQQ